LAKRYGAKTPASNRRVSRAARATVTETSIERPIVRVREESAESSVDVVAGAQQRDG
jgi:hypothetical protein